MPSNPKPGTMAALLEQAQASVRPAVKPARKKRTVKQKPVARKQEPAARQTTVKAPKVTVVKPKRARRTRAEMDAVRAEKERLKAEREAERVVTRKLVAAAQAHHAEEAAARKAERAKAVADAAARKAAGEAEARCTEAERKVVQPDPTKPPLFTPLPGERKYTKPQPLAPVAGAPTPITFPPPYDWQREVWSALDVYRFVACVTAQQIGKTTLAVEWATDGGMKGEDVWWVAPDFSLTEPGYDMFAQLFSQPPWNQVIDSQGHKMVEEQKKRLLFTIRNNGKIGTIQIKSADEPNKLRGKTLNRVVMDECAFMHPDAWHANLIHRLTIRHGKALFISNPAGKNWLWELWRLGDPANPHRDPDYASFQFSQSANPAISLDEIQKKQLHMPYRQYQREVLGMFTEDGGDVFAGVRKAATVLPNLPPTGVYNPSHQYVAGMDMSAGRGDYSVIMVFDVTDMAQAAMYRFSEPDLPGHIRVLRQVYDYWKPELFEIEENQAALLAVPEFARLGLPVRAFNTNWKSKGDLIQNYAAAIELGRIRLLLDADLIKEHESMESDVAPGGTVRYHSPRNGHDDIVMSSALAYRAATVREASQLPSFVRGTHTGLYENHLPERTYPSWTRTRAHHPPQRHGEPDFRR